MVQCPQCKTKDPNNALKCESCGTSLRSAQPSKGAALNDVISKLFDKLDTLNERISAIEQNTGCGSSVFHF